MPRSPSLPLHDYDDLDFSSPDPLATSQNDENAIRCATRSTSPFKHIALSSPSKRRTIDAASRNATPQRQSSSQWIRGDMNSPSKTVTEQTLSPWKIRVTVETEPEDIDMDMRSTRTRTTKIPLRDVSSPVEATTRGRKSQPSSARAKRRSTPVRKNSRIRRQSVTDLDIIVLGDDGDSNDWTQQKSSPKKSRASRSKKSEQVEATTEANEPQPTSEKPKRRARASQKPVEIRQDTDAEAEEENPEQAVEDNDSPELRSIDLNRVSVRPRSMSSKQRTNSVVQSDTDLRNRVDQKSQQPPQSHEKLVAEDPRQVLGRLVYPTPDPSTQNSDDLQNLPADPTDEHEGFDTILESEGFTMIDLESIPSARNFYSSPMESGIPGRDIPELLESPSGKREIETNAQIPAKNKPSVPASIRPRPTPIPSYLTLNEGESDISSNIPSSPPISQQRQVGPLSTKNSRPVRQVTPQPYSSPNLPSPPQAQPYGKGEAPRLVKVVRAGIALQGVLSPRANSDKSASLSPEHADTSKERLDNLFEGFDSGTRRELRAGLRFGEELAKRQRPTRRVFSGGNTSHLSGGAQLKALDTNARTRKSSPRKSLPATQVWRGEALVQHTPVHLVTESKLDVEMREKHSLPSEATVSEEHEKHKSPLSQKNKNVNSTPSKPTSKTPSSGVLNTEAKREKQWQLEREAVSKQIENADKDQVITIESDDETQQNPVRPSAYEDVVENGEEDFDHWAEQAVSSTNQRERSDSPRVSKTADSADLFPTDERRRQQQRAKDIISRPRRSMIPSPWKRGQTVTDDSTMLTNEDMTRLFDHDPKSKIMFGGAEVERQRRQLNSSFDVDRMAGTPGKSLAGVSEDPNSLEESEICSDGEGESHETEASDMKQLQTELELEQSRFEDNGVSGDEDLESEPKSGEVVLQHYEDWETSQEALSPQETSFQQHDQVHEEPQAYSEHVEDTGSSRLDVAADESSMSLLSHPEVVKIPVNFNDSTISRSAISLPTTRCSPSTPDDHQPSSSRPATPRSAMKGGRSGLGLESSADSSAPGKRKVFFSKHQTWVYADGEELERSVKSASPASSVVSGLEEGNVQSGAQKVGEGGGSWMGWFWGGLKSSASPSPTATTASSILRTDGADDADANGVIWQKTKSSILSSSHTSNRTSTKIPSYLLPPSYPSDPNRNHAIPLPMSGEFTDTHFRTLHIIYAKSLRPRFHAPHIDEVRAGLKELIGEKHVVDESKSGLGVFEWTVDGEVCRVVERFMREVEWGWRDVDGKGKWGWSEREIVGWLCRVVVGEEVRKEEREVGEKENGNGVGVQE